jgi:hypothetical protein
MTNLMHKFLIYFIYLFASALHVSGFLLAYLQRQAYNFGSGSSLLGIFFNSNYSMSHYIVILHALYYLTLNTFNSYKL